MNPTTTAIAGFIVGFVVSNHVKATFTKVQTDSDTGQVISVEEFDSLWDAGTAALREWLEDGDGET